MSSTEEVTLSMIWGVLNKLSTLPEKIEDVRKDLKQDIAQLNSRMEKLENENKALRDGHTELQETVHNIATTVSTIDEQLREEMLRIRKAANIMLFGVDETEKGFDDAQALMKLLLPNRMDLFCMKRIGKEQQSPRPLVVYLNNAGERGMALSNKKLLKHHPQFSRISVQPDETMQQREQSKERRGKKRSAEGETGGPSSSSQMAKVVRRENQCLNGQQAAAAAGLAPSPSSSSPADDLMEFHHD